MRASFTLWFWALCSSSLLFVACGDDESEGGLTLGGGAGTAGSSSGAGGKAVGGSAGTGGIGIAGSVNQAGTGGSNASGGSSSVGGNATGGDGALGGSGGSGGSVETATVADVQQGVATGEVALSGVYVTAIDAVGTSRGIWVADGLAGASWEGVYVYTGTTLPSVGVGDEVALTGTVVEFDTAPASGDTLTEIQTTPLQVNVITADAGTPTPVVVGADVLADITNGEAYEGVLVQVSTVKVTNLGTSNRFTVTDNDANDLLVDNDIFTATPSLNDCYSSITGIMSINVVDNVRNLAPRSAGDLVAGSGCN